MTAQEYTARGRKLMMKPGISGAEIQEATDFFISAAELSPTVASFLNLVGVFRWRGEHNNVMVAYDMALKVAPNDPLLRLAAASELPRVSPPGFCFDSWKAKLLDILHGMTTIDIDEAADNPTWEFAPPPFYAKYRGASVGIMSAYGRLFRTSRTWTKGGGGVGFVVPRKQSIIFLKSSLGVISKWDYSRSTLTIVCGRQELMPLKYSINNPQVKYLLLRGGIKEKVQAIMNAGFDVVYHFDPTSDPLGYFLSFYPLAPRQFTSWGASDSAGIPGVNFISSKLWEPREAERNYSEKLHLLSGFPFYYLRPAPPSGTLGREAFSLDARDHVYICPQSIQKVRPEFEHLIAEILARDPAGKIVLIDSCEPCRTRYLLDARFQRSIPEDLRKRIVWTPFIEWPEYFSLLQCADVILDTPFFSGCNTSLEALSLGVPIVTLPGQFMRGRYTYGFYTRMGFDSLVAADEADYVEKALQLGTDRDYREHCKQRILASNEVLYGQEADAREFQEALEGTP